MTLRQLEEWVDKDPIVSESGIQEDIRRLQAMFDRYKELISEFGDCIIAYQITHKRLFIRVLLVYFRLNRNRIDQRSLEHYRLNALSQQHGHVEKTKFSSFRYHISTTNPCLSGIGRRGLVFIVTRLCLKRYF